MWGMVMFIPAPVISVTRMEMSDGVDVMITFLGGLGAVMLAFWWHPFS